MMAENKKLRPRSGGVWVQVGDELVKKEGPPQEVIPTLPSTPPVQPAAAQDDDEEEEED